MLNSEILAGERQILEYMAHKAIASRGGRLVAMISVVGPAKMQS